MPISPPNAATEAGLDPFALVRDELQLVESELAAGGECDVRAITDISDYLRQSGGKRIRPAVVLLAARLSECPPAPRVQLAAVVEMIHAATLIHDDIIDESLTRRGQPSANARWGNQKCVLAGDWLYMQSFRVALEQRNFAILDSLISLTQNMVEGELLQLDMQSHVVSPSQHLELMERKTARLFAVASQLGALAARRPEGELERLGRFGRHLGLAFQMVDDLLDFTASEEHLGKPVGNDLREGKMTLPAIYAYERATPAGRACLEQVMREGSYAQVSLTDIQVLLDSTGGFTRARVESREQAELALEALDGFPASPWRSALASLPELVIVRSK